MGRRSASPATHGYGLADYVDQNNRLFGVPTPRDNIPADELQALAAQGAAMSLDEIVAYALEVPSSASRRRMWRSRS